jgi:hypothetical protein
MAEMTIKPTYALRVSHQELKLILKGLGGRAFINDEAEQAKELGDFLTKARASELKMYSEQVELHASKVD